MANSASGSLLSRCGAGAAALESPVGLRGLAGFFFKRYPQATLKLGVFPVSSAERFAILS
jgi:hypothetical protein